MNRPQVYKELEPDEHLRQYIKCYWKFEKKYDQDEYERVFPDSSYELVYEQAATYTVDGAKLPRLFVVGQLDKPTDFYAKGTAEHWAVRFYPWGLKPFGDLSAVTGKVWVAADKVLPPDDCKELETLLQTHDDASVPSRLDEFFMKRLLSWQFDDVTLQKAFKKLQTQHGSIKIKDLADYCYISQRQLSRKVATATGQSPHEIASRLRFEQVRDAIMHNPDAPLTFLAHQFNYTDQSHLIKEFRHYANMTPSAYAEGSRASRPQMQDRNNVLFLQFPTNS